MEQATETPWFIEQPYLDEDVFVVKFGQQYDYDHMPEAAFLDLRNILQVYGIFNRNDYWSFSVLYRFQPDSTPFYICYQHSMSKDRATEMPPEFVKRQHEDLTRAWMACRRKYAPKPA